MTLPKIIAAIRSILAFIPEETRKEILAAILKLITKEQKKLG